MIHCQMRCQVGLDSNLVNKINRDLGLRSATAPPVPGPEHRAQRVRELAVPSLPPSGRRFSMSACAGVMKHSMASFSANENVRKTKAMPQVASNPVGVAAVVAVAVAVPKTSHKPWSKQMHLPHRVLPLW